jgi:hypothetical protein
MPPGVLKLADRVPTLFNHTVQNDNRLFVVQADALIDFTLLNGSDNKTYGTQPVFISGPHGRFHFVLNTVFE